VCLFKRNWLVDNPECSLFNSLHYMQCGACILCTHPLSVLCNSVCTSHLATKHGVCDLSAEFLALKWGVFSLGRKVCTGCCPGFSWINNREVCWLTFCDWATLAW